MSLSDHEILEQPAGRSQTHQALVATALFTRSIWLGRNDTVHKQKETMESLVYSAGLAEMQHYQPLKSTDTTSLQYALLLNEADPPPKEDGYNASAELEPCSSNKAVTNKVSPTTTNARISVRPTHPSPTHCAPTVTYYTKKGQQHSRG